MARVAPQATDMLEQIGRALAEADGVEFQLDPARFRRLAAALMPLARPTDTMVDAAHEAVSFDGAWAIRGRSDFRKVIRTATAGHRMSLVWSLCCRGKMG